MIITIVSETFLPEINGVAMTLGKLVTGLIDGGHCVQLVCPHIKNRNIIKGISYHPVKGIPIPRYSEAKFGLPSKKILNKLWLKQRPDVIYVATEGPLGWSAINLAKKLDIPSVSGFHTNFHTYSQHYGIGLIEKIVLKYLVTLHNKSKMTLTPTQEQKNKLSDMGINDVSILSRGVDTDLFSPAKRDINLRLSWGVVNQQDPVLLYVGRLAAEKNISLAVETYHAMHKKVNNLKFVLVGTGPLLTRLQRENPNFIFAGKKTGEELARYYASSDIFVFPSKTETFGNVVLEAMACGLGVNAYDYAAANIHIKHSINGMVTNTDNANQFIFNACKYIDDYIFLEKIKKRASEHSLNNNWSEVSCVFEKILSSQAIK